MRSMRISFGETRARRQRMREEQASTLQESRET